MKIEAVDIQNISGIQSIPLPEELRINDDKVYKKNGGYNLYYPISYSLAKFLR